MVKDTTGEGTATAQVQSSREQVLGGREQVIEVLRLAREAREGDDRDEEGIDTDEGGIDTSGAAERLYEACRALPGHLLERLGEAVKQVAG